MPEIVIVPKITRGTVCRDEWIADVTLLCADRIAPGEKAPLFLEIVWRGSSGEPSESADAAAPSGLKFQFKGIGAEGAGGSIRFDDADGATEKRFEGSTRKLYWIYGAKESLGDSEDIALEISNEGQILARALLSVKSGAPSLAIRSEDGTEAPKVVSTGKECKLRAVPEPPGPGAYRWLDLSAESGVISGDRRSQNVALKFAEASAALNEFTLFAYFKPENGPACAATHVMTAFSCAIAVPAQEKTPILLPVGKKRKFTALLRPAAAVEEVAWRIESDEPRLVILGPAAAAEVEVEASAPSAKAGDAVLILEARAKGGAVLPCRVALTLFRATLRSADGSAPPRIIELNRPLAVKVLIDPAFVELNADWSIPKVLAKTRNATLVSVSKDKPSTAMIKGTAVPEPFAKECLEVIASLTVEGSATPVLILSHAFSVTMRCALALFADFAADPSPWTLVNDFGAIVKVKDANGVLVDRTRRYVVLSRADPLNLYAAFDGILRATPPEGVAQAATIRELATPLDAAAPAQVTLFLESEPESFADSRFRARTNATSLPTGCVYVNVETASLAGALGACVWQGLKEEELARLTPAQKIEGLIRGRLTVLVQRGEVIGKAAVGVLVEGKPSAGFAMIAGGDLVDPTKVYSALREFVAGKDDAVNRFLDVAPEIHDLYSPGLTPEQFGQRVGAGLCTYKGIERAIERLTADITDAVARQTKQNEYRQTAYTEDNFRMHKAVYRTRLLRLAGRAPASETEPPFQFNPFDSGNFAQLWAVVEFFIHYADPWAPQAPPMEGENKPLAPGNNPPTDDLASGWHLVQIDCFGPRVGGTGAKVEGAVIHLDGNPDLYRGPIPIPTPKPQDFVVGKTIVLLDDRARPEKTYTIADSDYEKLTVIVDGNPDLPEGGSRWRIETPKKGPMEGARASVLGSVVTLGAIEGPNGQTRFNKINLGFDTIRLHSDWGSRAGIYRILGKVTKGNLLLLDGVPDLRGGESDWSVPAGLGKRRSAEELDLIGPGGDKGFDGYGGRMFIIRDRVVLEDQYHFTSYTSRRQAGQGSTSIRGNRRYSAYSCPSVSNSFINYGFLVKDHDNLHCKEARYYFKSLVAPDNAITVTPPDPNDPNPPLWKLMGKSGVMIHKGNNLASNGSGSGGCQVSNEFYEFRKKMIELYQIDYKKAHPEDPDGLNNDIQALADFPLASAHNDSVSHFNARTQIQRETLWLSKIGTNSYWLIRPDERPLALMPLIFRFPDSMQGDFKGTPLDILPDRLPYLFWSKNKIDMDYEKSFTKSGKYSDNEKAMPLVPGAGPGEFEAGPDVLLETGKTYHLVLPGHVFVKTASNSRPGLAWQRLVDFKGLEPSAFSYTLPIGLKKIDKDVPNNIPEHYEATITPLGEGESRWGAERRSIYAVCVVPYLNAKKSAELTEPWQRATKDLREAIGEYPPFSEGLLPMHEALTPEETAKIKAVYDPPEYFLRFPANGAATYVRLTKDDPSAPKPNPPAAELAEPENDEDFHLESLFWKRTTVDSVEEIQRFSYLPLPKRETLVTAKRLWRALRGYSVKLRVLTGFVPPKVIDDALKVRKVDSSSGRRIHDHRHAYGDAVDFIWEDKSLAVSANGMEAAAKLFPFPDTTDEDIIAARRNARFERILVNMQAEPAAPKAEFATVLHVGGDASRVSPVIAVYDGGERPAAPPADDSRPALVKLVHGPAERAGGFYHALHTAGGALGFVILLFSSTDPDLGKLLAVFDADRCSAGIGNPPEDFERSAATEAAVSVLFGQFDPRPAFVALSLDHAPSSAPAGAAPEGLKGIRLFGNAEAAGGFRIVVWMGEEKNSAVRWAALRRSDQDPILAPMKTAVEWTPAGRKKQLDQSLALGVLRDVWNGYGDEQRYAHDISVPAGLQENEMADALLWLGRVSMLSGSRALCFRFEEYPQGYAAFAAALGAARGGLLA